MPMDREGGQQNREPALLSAVTVSLMREYVAEQREALVMKGFCQQCSRG